MASQTKAKRPKNDTPMMNYVPLKRFAGWSGFNAEGRPTGVQFLKSTLNEIKFIPDLNAVYVEQRHPVNQERTITRANLGQFLYYDIVPDEEIPAELVTKDNPKMAGDTPSPVTDAA